MLGQSKLVLPFRRQFSLLSPAPGWARYGRDQLSLNATSTFTCSYCSSPSPLVSRFRLCGSGSSQFYSIRNTGSSGLWNSKQFRSQLPVLSRGCGNPASKPAPELPEDVTLPPLMDFPQIIWPSLKSIGNWLFTYVSIWSSIDKDFSLREFNNGAEQALLVISDRLSKGEYEDLEGLIESSALEEIKKNTVNFTKDQRELLKVEEDDIFFSFPYEIRIISPPENSEQAGSSSVQRVEITMVFHSMPGFLSMQSTGGGTGKKPSTTVCNYRFFKDFSEGNNESSWTANVVNHFKPPASSGLQF